jgi:peroxiredoxin Q/BCP
MPSVPRYPTDMYHTRRPIAFFSIILVTVILAGCPFPPPPETGTPAPDFTLSNQDRKPVSLRDYRGKWVVIFFYRGDFGQRSTTEARAFQRDVQKFDGANTALLGISGDGVSSHKAFAGEERLEFPLLSDPDLRVTKLYGSLTRRFIHTVVAYNVFIVDPQGKIVRVLSDFDANDPSGRVLTALHGAQQHQPS